jgi:hypothetical protein
LSCGARAEGDLMVVLLAEVDVDVKEDSVEDEVL